MSHFFAPIDDQIAASIKVIIRKSPSFTVPVDGIAQYLGTPFPFQLPPKISGDGKAADWEETGRISYEPLALWMGAQARTLKIDAQYVLTGGSSNGHVWNGQTIANIASAAKAYFYRTLVANEDSEAKKDQKGDDPAKPEGDKVPAAPGSGSKGKAYGPVVQIDSLFGAVRKTSTWRLISVSIEYSESIVKDGDKYYPLWTKISFDCKSYTGIKDVNGKDKDKLKQIGALEASPSWEWF